MILIGNTNFEMELGATTSLSFQEGIKCRLTDQQLQFLPLFFGKQSDVVAVTALPPDEYLESIKKKWPLPLPSLVTLDEVLFSSKEPIVSWGPSRMLEKCVGKKRYQIPDWNLLKEIQSKAYLVKKGWGIPGSAVIWSEEELLHWCEGVQGKKKIKHCFKLSGQGHHCINDVREIKKGFLQRFLNQQWSQGFPVVAQPFLNATHTFSSHWFVSPSKGVHFLGATTLLCNAKGAFVYVEAPINSEVDLTAHLSEATMILESLLSRGFFGHISFDVLDTESGCFICELNARHTFGWLAWFLQKSVFSDHSLRLSFSKEEEKGVALLPKALSNSLSFPYQVYLSHFFI